MHVLSLAMEPNIAVEYNKIDKNVSSAEVASILLMLPCL